MVRFRRNVAAFIRAARVAHLATADAAGEPLVIPICFVFDGKRFYTPVDEKPKRVPAGELRRVKNIRVNPHVCLIVDRYDEDWRRLAYVLIAGRGRLLHAGSSHGRAVALLRRKYEQYRTMSLEQRPIITISPSRLVTWGKL